MEGRQGRPRQSGEAMGRKERREQETFSESAFIVGWLLEMRRKASFSSSQVLQLLWYGFLGLLSSRFYPDMEACRLGKTGPCWAEAERNLHRLQRIARGGQAFQRGPSAATDRIAGLYR